MCASFFSPKAPGLEKLSGKFFSPGCPFVPAQQGQAGPQGLLQCLVSVQLTLTSCLQLSAKPTCSHWPCKGDLDRDTSKAKGDPPSCLSFPNTLELPQEHFFPMHSAEKTPANLPHQWCLNHVQPCCPQPHGDSYLSAGTGGSKQPQNQDLAPHCVSAHSAGMCWSRWTALSRGTGCPLLGDLIAAARGSCPHPDKCWAPRHGAGVLPVLLHSPQLHCSSPSSIPAAGLEHPTGHPHWQGCWCPIPPFWEGARGKETCTSPLFVW